MDIERASDMFGHTDLVTLVQCAKNALGAEDKQLRTWSETRGWKATFDGINSEGLRESYYQTIIWRELVRAHTFTWRTRMECRYRSYIGPYDLGFSDPATDKPVALAEIKGWWSEEGEFELPGIKNDMDKLRLPEVPGVMVILTCQPCRLAEENYQWLANQLSVGREQLVTESFPLPRRGSQEFAVIGFLVASKAAAASA